jgi:hypothetical protein
MCYSVGILLTCGKHLHDRFISLKREVCAHKTSLMRPRFMSHVFGGANFASFYHFTVGFWNSSDSVVTFLFFILLFLQQQMDNTGQIQHCSISTKFHMWVDYDVPNWFLTSKNFYQSPFQESIRDIIIYPHMKCRWNRTMLNLCSIVVAILKMTTGRNFSISGINSEHHNLPTYEMSLKSNNDIIKIWYVDR